MSSAAADPSSSRASSGRLRPAWIGQTSTLIVLGAMAFQVLCALPLMPTSGQPYDLASLTGASEAWLRWGLPLLYNWKFGLDLSLVGVGAQGVRYLLELLGMSGAAALATGWKIPLVAANLLTGASLLDLGHLLRVRRPALVPTLWLLSPVSLWVAAGHGQVEPYTVLAFVLSLNLLLRHRPFLAGVVVGLGIGAEFLPAGMVLVVGLCAYAGLLRREEVLGFLLGMVLAIELCFEGSFLSSVARDSLISGLGFTVTVTQGGPSSGPAASAGSSLWSIIGVSPGKAWLLVLVVTGGVLLWVLGHKARRRPDVADRRKLASVGAGGLLLALVLLDPGALPQFADLTLGALCLIALGVQLNPIAVILGPLLQLASGLFFVYGGDFQSYWYDMWARTGKAGWPFPDSLALANSAALLGALLVVGGLVLAPLQRGLPRLPSLRGSLVPAIAVAVLGSMFFGVWSLQPAFWQGVGSHGPARLADFESLTATQYLTIDPHNGSTVIRAQPLLLAAEQGAAVAPKLTVTLETRPIYAQSNATAAVSASSPEPPVEIRNWADQRPVLQKLWVTVIAGRKGWSSQSAPLADLPYMDVARTKHRPQSATWLSPGWAMLTYSVPASAIPSSGVVAVRLEGPYRSAAGRLLWDGTARKRWLLIEFQKGEAVAKVDGVAYRSSAEASPPAPGDLGREEANVSGIPPAARWTISDLRLGGVPARAATAALVWPSASPLDSVVSPYLLGSIGLAFLLLVVLGIVYVARALGGPLPDGASPPERWLSPAPNPLLASIRIQLRARKESVRLPWRRRAAACPVRQAKRPSETGRVVMTSRYPLSEAGGVERVVGELIRELNQRPSSGWSAESVSAFGRPRGLARVPVIGDLVASIRLTGRIPADAEIIVVHGAEYAWAPILLGRLTRRPVVAVWHGVRALEPLPPATGIVARALQWLFLRASGRLQRIALGADRTVAVGPATVEAIRSAYGWKGEASVITNGAPQLAGRRTITSRDSQGGAGAALRRGLRVVWVGTTGYQKGLDIALSACHIARAEGVPLQLAVVGLAAPDGAHQRPWLEMPWISWKGRISPEAFDQLLGRQDVLISPTRYEGFGMGVLEAMAAGVPVIGSEAVSWVLGGAGVVISDESPYSYAKALHLMANPAYRCDCVAAGAARAGDFTWEAAGMAYLQLFESLRTAASGTVRGPGREEEARPSSPSREGNLSG